MSITYRGIIGHKAAVTMPSVEAWGNNKNILRDPPKSVMTRRIDKVNQDGSLNEMFYHSGDRFAEHVNVFARGVNPMVSVEYGNNNSFSMSKNNGNAFYAAGKLPHRIMQGGAFHPPLLRQEQLLPLSRQPRNITFVATNKESIDFAKSALCEQQPKEHRQIVKNKIEGFIAPTKTFKMDTPVEEFFALNFLNDNLPSYQTTTNLSAKGETNILNFDESNKILDRNIPLYDAIAQKTLNIATLVRPDKEIVLDSNTPLADVQAVRGLNIATLVRPDKEIVLDSNTPLADVQAVRGRNIAGNGILETRMDLERNVPQYLVRDSKQLHTGKSAILNSDVQLNMNLPHHVVANTKGFNTGQRTIINDEISLQENLPHYNFEVNKGTSRVQFQNHYDHEKEFENKTPHIMVQSSKSQNTKTTEIQSKTFTRLHDTVSPGSMEGRVLIPTSNRNATYITNFSTNKRDLARKMMNERV